MEVLQNTVINGEEYKELVDANYEALSKTEADYGARGWQTRLILFDVCKGTWLLTVWKVRR